jgi:hypothetical protein
MIWIKRNSKKNRFLLEKLLAKNYKKETIYPIQLYLKSFLEKKIFLISKTTFLWLNEHPLIYTIFFYFLIKKKLKLDKHYLLFEMKPTN